MKCAVAFYEGLSKVMPANCCAARIDKLVGILLQQASRDVSGMLPSPVDVVWVDRALLVRNRLDVYYVVAAMELASPEGFSVKVDGPGQHITANNVEQLQDAVLSLLRNPVVVRIVAHASGVKVAGMTDAELNLSIDLLRSSENA